MNAQQLATDNDRLACHAAKSWYGFGRFWGVDAEDILQAARMGLFMACNRFEPERGHRLSSFAYPWMKKFIRDEIDKARPVGFKRGSLANDRVYGRALPCPGTDSLNDPLPSGDGETLDLIADANGERQDEALLRFEIREIVRALRDERIRDVLTMRFGLDGEPEMDFRDIGRRIGFSHEHARRLVVEGIASLRRRLHAGDRGGIHGANTSNTEYTENGHARAKGAPSRRNLASAPLLGPGLPKGGVTTVPV